MSAHPDSPHADVLPSYHSILPGVDSSDYANRGIDDAVTLAETFGSQLTAAHVYAAKMHDLRFRQMEGGLPQQFQQEHELERQRDVHDSLITKGLSIITDAYMDQVQAQAGRLSRPVQRRSLEGKNYRELVRETNSGDYDLLVMGALGLGAVNGSRVGTVCRRVARRSQTDTLVVKQPERSLREGPLVVGVDGSPKSYGALMTALSFAKAWQLEVKVVSAFDPYYHYVAFNRIAGVLSAEAGQVFKFQEQEKLHEEIIDSGLAKIYQGHLAVAQTLAADVGMDIETTLLDGKPHDVILRYLDEIQPSLLLLGMTGIHADPDLDIGGNTEYLLSDAPCAVLLSQRTYQPQVERLAAVSISWTEEAEARMARVPSFVRSMAKLAILRFAQDKGHTVITARIVEEATAQLMPNHAETAMREIVDAHEQQAASDTATVVPLRWHEDATRLLLGVKDLSVRGNLSMRAEKKARSEGAQRVEAAHIRAFIPSAEEPVDNNASQATVDAVPKETLELSWQAAALARLMRVPAGFMRDASKQRVEAYARSQGVAEIDLACVEGGLAAAREAMAAAQSAPDQASGSIMSPAPADTTPDHATADPSAKLEWSDAAHDLLTTVPDGFCRTMTEKAVNTIASQQALTEVDADFVAQIMDTFKAGATQVAASMPWDAAATDRIARAPETVRGMLVKEIEGWSQRQGMSRVTEAAVAAVKQHWMGRGRFHLDPDDPRSQ